MTALDTSGCAVTADPETLAFRAVHDMPPKSITVDLDTWDVERIVVRHGGTEHVYDTALLLAALDRIAKEEDTWTSVPRVCR